MKTQSLLSLDDIVLVPQYSTLRSRKDAITSTNLWEYKLNNPLISSNMETITGSKMAITMWQSGGIGALHRFWSVEENIQEYRKVREKNANCIVSVGVNEESKERAIGLYNVGARVFVIDIAHGHSLVMKEMLQWMKQKWGNDIFVIAGNCSTGQSVSDLQEWGADAIKLFVGSGSACTTRVVTGHGTPTASCLLECSKEASVPLIADGGIKNSGDIVKALALGADFVMLGSLLSATNETPGENVIRSDGVMCKLYKGSSSYDRIGTTKEGVETYVPLKGKVSDIIESLVGGLRSGMSYCNAKNLSDINLNAVWEIQTHNSYLEGMPHILRIV